MGHKDKIKSVSAIIPAYNSEMYISNAIDSVFAQTLPPDEIIVVDDGSTDNTEKIVESYPNVKYLHQEHSGVSSARNKGIKNSSSKWIAFLDSDDLWMPEHLEYIIDLLIKYDLEWACGDKINVKYKENILPKVYLEHKIALKCGSFVKNYLAPDVLPFVNLSGLVASKKALEEEGCFDETFNNGEDNELALRFAYRYPEIGYLKGSIIRRIRKHSLSMRENPVSYNILKKHCDIISNSKRKDLVFVLSSLASASMLYFIEKREQTLLQKAYKDYGYLLDNQKIRRLCVLASYSMCFAYVLFKISQIKDLLKQSINRWGCQYK